MKAHERFLNYVKINTKSDTESGAHPSSASEFELAKLLKSELEALGCQDVILDEKCYLYAKIPATKGFEKKRKLGFIAHIDTAPDFSADGVNPMIHENYDGKDVKLGNSGRTLSVSTFPHLSSLAGRTLITTDGTTLLGADDKAGVAEIMTLAEILTGENVAHGPISIAFTPDEEIGEGADFFDVKLFGADFAYTVDGGAEGSLEYENFNASSATFKIHGVNVHPGSAKNTMVNASLVAMEINSHLPTLETPANTEGYEGFYHLTNISGNIEYAELNYIVRDHSKERFASREETLRHVAKIMNEKYKDGTVSLEIKESYRNMREMVEPHMHLVENAKRAAVAAGVTPSVEPIRGGTDGARLSFMGLVCPNLGTGGYAFHGPFEHITKEGMDSAVNILLEIVKIYSEE